MEAQVTLGVDGTLRPLAVDTRVTLLDVLRERLGVTLPGDTRRAPEAGGVLWGAACCETMGGQRAW